MEFMPDLPNNSGQNLSPRAAQFRSGVPGSQGRFPAEPGPKGAAAYKLGTQISPQGIVTVRTLVDDMEVAFAAIRDTVRFLASLYPEYSYPALVSGIAFQPGAKYKVEHFERKKIEHLDSTEREIQIRRHKFITIKSIVDEMQYKIMEFEVDSKVEGDIPTEVFPPTTYIYVELSLYPYDQNQMQLSLTMDGGPPDVETTYCCLCIANPGSQAMQQESQEMRPHIYSQMNKFTEYLKSYDPNTSLALQVQTSVSHSPVRRKFSSTTQNSSQMHNTYSYNSKSPKQPMPHYTQTSRQQLTPRMNKSPFVKPNPNVNFGTQMVPPSPIMKYNVSGLNLGNSGIMRKPSQGSFSSSRMNVKSPYGKPPLPPDLDEDNLSSNANTNANTKADEIKKLFDLFQMGAISQVEYEEEKKRLMNQQRNTVNF